LALLVQQGNFSIITPIPTVTLQKIVQGAHTSRQLSLAKKRLVASA
jgi:hypothetical protein